MRVCVSIVDAGPKDALASGLLAQERGADLIEFRFDKMARPPQDLTPFKKVTVPKIATLRTAAQGGGSELGDHDRLRFFQRAARAGFEYVDIEDGSPLLARTWRELRGVHVICSHHDWDGTPGVSAILEKLVSLASQGDVAKAAYTVRSVRGLHNLVTAGRLFAPTGDRFVLIGMGELGEVTRVLGERIGSWWSYASLEKGKEAAPGQLDLATLKALGKEPMVTGLTGFPLAHSYSPLLHDAAFKALGIPGRYLTFPAQEDELEDLLDVVRDLGIRGLNVTIPHKEKIIPLLDSIDPPAARIGAVNVVVNQGGKLVGRNSDVTGVGNAFRAAGASLRGKKVLVIGAGGGARACCAYLLEEGADIWVANRTLERAQALAGDFGAKVIGLEDAPGREFDAVINATPVGMHGFPEGMPIDPAVLRPGQWVMDLIYNPVRTPFLAEAEARGGKTISGMEMLIYQAMDAFEAWTGRRPPYEAMAAGLRAG
jgi:shikimate dehydrogenase/3-dehydroquinate dehydratase type I